VALTQVPGSRASTANRQQEWLAPTANGQSNHEASRVPSCASYLSIHHSNPTELYTSSCHFILSAAVPDAPLHDLLAFTRQPQCHARSHIARSNAMVGKAASPREAPPPTSRNMQLQFPLPISTVTKFLCSCHRLPAHARQNPLELWIVRQCCVSIPLVLQLHRVQTRPHLPTVGCSFGAPPNLNGLNRDCVRLVASLPHPFYSIGYPCVVQQMPRAPQAWAMRITKDLRSIIADTELTTRDNRQTEALRHHHEECSL
jgi:hypothetical protein